MKAYQIKANRVQVSYVVVVAQDSSEAWCMAKDMQEHQWFVEESTEWELEDVECIGNGKPESE